MTLNNGAPIETGIKSQRSANDASALHSRSESWIQASDNTILDGSQLVIIDNVYASVYLEPLPALEETYDNIEAELQAMANDPDIQREMRKIAAEFRVTDGDGLTDLP
jgi:hypothetical protein